ncbi:MAG: UPF0280 family protein [Burkholderiaceae bacterium]
MGPRRARFTDGRWHFQHGPIDLIIGADGDAPAVDVAHAAAWRRFETILDELVAELPMLKQPVRGHSPSMRGVVARRMWQACAPHGDRFITPMAAVAGAVADEVIVSYRRAGVRRAWVNNGGDIALHLVEGESLRTGIHADLAHTEPLLDGYFDIAHDMPVRGIATSGWRGRSFSMGIADSVTVIARTAAEADAAATMIANAVNVDDARIVRRAASILKDDSDLGDRLVTVAVPPLDVDGVRCALHAGVERAHTLRDEGLIVACALFCQGQAMICEAHSGRWHATRVDVLNLEAA